MKKSYVVILMLILLGTNMLFADEEKIETDNLLKYVFQDVDKDGMPDGYTFKKRKGGKTATISYDNKVFFGKKGPSLKITLLQEGDMYLSSPMLKNLQPGKQYLFTMNVKIKDMHITGKWYNTGAHRCFITYIFGDGKTLAWMAFHDNGSTDDWVTIMCPFKFSEGNVRLSLRCKNMSGTVWIQNPTILELAGGMEMDRHFMLKDGSVIKGLHFTIK